MASRETMLRLRIQDLQKAQRMARMLGFDDDVKHWASKEEEAREELRQIKGEQ